MECWRAEPGPGRSSTLSLSMGACYWHGVGGNMFHSSSGVSEVRCQIFPQIRSAAFFCVHNPRYLYPKPMAESKKTARGRCFDRRQASFGAFLVILYTERDDRERDRERDQEQENANPTPPRRPNAPNPHTEVRLRRFWAVDARGALMSGDLAPSGLRRAPPPKTRGHKRRAWG